MIPRSSRDRSAARQSMNLHKNSANNEWHELNIVMSRNFDWGNGLEIIIPNVFSYRGGNMIPRSVKGHGATRQATTIMF